MERDFLGINSSIRDSAPAGKDESAMAGRQDAAFLGPAVQWHFSNKVSSAQQCVPYKIMQQESPKNFVFEQSKKFQSASPIEPFEANHRVLPASAPQFPVRAYQSLGTEGFGPATHKLNEARTYPKVSHNHIPVASSSPYFKLHSSQGPANASVTSMRQQPFGGAAVNTPIVSSVVGSPASRNAPRPTPVSAQMTIFYAGTVTVYDDVPFDQAQAIMLLASKGSRNTSNACKGPISTSNAHKGPNSNSNASRSEASFLVTAPVPVKLSPSNGLEVKQASTPAPVRVASPCSCLSSPISVSSHTGANSRNASSTTDDTAGAKAVSSLATTCQQETPKAVPSASLSPATTVVMLRAVPQARKASIARFLEKRKERVTDAAPYPCTKKTSETDAASEKANASNKYPTAYLNLLSNQEDSWLGPPKSSIVTQGSPSTRLEI